VKRLLMSSSALGVEGWLEDGGCDHVLDVGEEFSGDVALEAADDLLFAEAFGGAAGRKSSQSPRDLAN
jgi:hypothetical protein